MLCIPIFGMLGVSRETTPFWYEIHTFVLTVYVRMSSFCKSSHKLAFLANHKTLPTKFNTRMVCT